MKVPIGWEIFMETLINTGSRCVVLSAIIDALDFEVMAYDELLQSVLHAIKYES
jgi:hypothetical protein